MVLKHIYNIGETFHTAGKYGREWKLETGHSVLSVWLEIKLYDHQYDQYTKFLVHKYYYLCATPQLCDTRPTTLVRKIFSFIFQHSTTTYDSNA